MTSSRGTRRAEPPSHQPAWPARAKGSFWPGYGAGAWPRDMVKDAGRATVLSFPSVAVIATGGVVGVVGLLTGRITP